MSGNLREDRVAREKNGVAIESALRDVYVGNGHRQPLASEGRPEIAHSNPMVERCLMDGRVLQELPDGGALLPGGGSADELCDHDGGHDGRAVRQRLLEQLRVPSGEEVDPFRGVNDDAGHGFPPDRCPAGTGREGRERVHKTAGA